MTKHLPRFLVLAGDGINCERETAAALIQAGGSTDIVHVNDLVAAPETLGRYDGLALPGGFSFGDELGSGQILALKLRHRLGDALQALAAAQKPVIGICNGFQVLVKLGLLPFPDRVGRVTALAPNAGGHFMDRWVTLQTLPSRCLWTEGMDGTNLELPVRHGEGRIVFKQGQEDALHAELLAAGQIPFVYAEDINGSHGRIAALTDPTGAVLGMMPHPEAFIHAETYRNRKPGGTGDGRQIFDNIIRIIKGQDKENDRRTA